MLPSPRGRLRFELGVPDRRVLAFASSREELYNRLIDPNEQTDLSSIENDSVTKMRETITHSFTSSEQMSNRLDLPEGEATLELDEFTEQALKEMGYIE